MAKENGWHLSRVLEVPINLKLRLFDGITTWALFTTTFSTQRERTMKTVNFPECLTAYASASCGTPSSYKIFPVFVNTMQLFHVEVGDTEASALHTPLQRLHASLYIDVRQLYCIKFRIE